MRSAEQISQSIRANLRVLDPDISTEPLTPERKIIDTVAEVIAEAEVDNYVLNYQYDIDTKIGADLDKFVALFGFARQSGRSATGTVTFSRASAADRDIVIPAGTQVVKPSTTVSPAVIFQTTATVTLYIGTTEVDASIRCTTVGNIGNVTANQITIITSGGGDISAVTNAAPTTGGSEEETDAELRVRFKNTVFRNIAGTSDQYLALSIASRFTKKANVIGPISRFSEYLQIANQTAPGAPTVAINAVAGNLNGAYTYKVTFINSIGETAGGTTSATVSPVNQQVNVTNISVGAAGTTARKLYRTAAGGADGTQKLVATINDNTTTAYTDNIADGSLGATVPSATLSGAVSQIPYSKWSHGFDYYLTDGNPTNETFYTPRGADYTFNTSMPPTVKVNNAVVLPNNKIVLLEHSYTSANSRNDPATNVLNYVDVFVSGSDVVLASESSVFPSTTNNFVAGSGTYGVNNWKRAVDGSAPLTSSRLQELLWQPVESLPGTITIGINTYTLNTHYWLVKDVTVSKGSRRSRDGIEWAAAVIAAETVGTAFSLTYNFDMLPLTLNELMDSHKQIASDVLVHSATERYFKVFLTIMYTPGFSTTAVDSAISTALTSFLERMNFGAVIQISDILDVVHDVPGVDNVRLTTSTENATSYGIREVNLSGANIGSPHTNDFALQDSDLPVLYSVTMLPKSQNTWSTI